MVHTKAQGSVKGHRDSVSKRLGVKKYGGQTVVAGNIIVRQKGTKVVAGDGVIMGKDYTLMAVQNGVVHFKTKVGKTVVEVKTA